MITMTDRTIVRDLARRVAEIGALPEMTARRLEWNRHNGLRPGRPMMLIFPEGSWGELLPDSVLKCADPQARRIEWDLRHRIYTFEHFASDNVVDAEWVVHKAIRSTGWGLEARHHDSPASRGAWAFDPVINEPADMRKLRFPEISVDDEATQRVLDGARDLFGDILDVKLKGVAHISFHLMNHWTGLRGLEQTMADMCENPAWLHDAMAFLEEGNRRVIEQYVALNLLSLNNDNTYCSTGGNGWTDELPAPGFDPEHVRPCDMWASAEAQELAQVGPRMHAEFSMQYEKRLLEPFGLTGYGCCEDLTNKLADVLTIPHIRRVSIAPMANVGRSAERLGSAAIFSWKPDPSVLVGEFDEGKLRAYIRHALHATRGCVMEMVLKDTHTCEHHPERFDRWTQIAREAIEEEG
ncbi:MAG: hypothetical protein FJX72_02000 [Armatimonadetes bacterium]|nr:hypothetical protein [Armatimonadota bacterium]